MLALPALVARAGAAEPPPVTRYRGTLSCSAVACHGGVASLSARNTAQTSNERPRNGGEYHVWLQRDPHAQGWQALVSERSRGMIRRLAQSAAVSEPGASGAATPGTRHYEAVWQRCLGCHSVSRDAPPPVVEVMGDADVRVEVASPLHEGVGCEACHGRATEPWQREHARGGWRERTSGEREQMGFLDVSNLLNRAKLCAGCHVGSAGRDVDHNLLAAGHPVLRFELAGYSEFLPKHWDDERERRALPWFEWRLWAAGQAASAAAALEVLRERARPVETRHAASAWPDFSEYSCESCHHDMRQTWRRARGFMTAGVLDWSRDLPHPRRIVPAWGLWPPGVLPELAVAALPANDPRAAAITDGLDDVRGRMQAGLVPDRDSVVVPADTAIARVERWLASPEVDGWLNASTRSPRPAAGRGTDPDFNRLAASRIAAGLLEQSSDLVDSWERATQAYLMAAAWERACRDQESANPKRDEDGVVRRAPEHDALIRELSRLRELLAIQPGSVDPDEPATVATANREANLPRRDEIQQRLERSLRMMQRLSEAQRFTVAP